MHLNSLEIELKPGPGVFVCFLLLLLLLLLYYIVVYTLKLFIRRPTPFWVVKKSNTYTTLVSLFCITCQRSVHISTRSFVVTLAVFRWRAEENSVNIVLKKLTFFNNCGSLRKETKFKIIIMGVTVDTIKEGDRKFNFNFFNSTYSRLLYWVVLVVQYNIRCMESRSYKAAVDI